MQARLPLLAFCLMPFYSHGFEAMPGREAKYSCRQNALPCNFGFRQAVSRGGRTVRHCACSAGCKSASDPDSRQAEHNWSNSHLECPALRAHFPRSMPA